MNLTLFSDSEVIAQTMKEHLIEGFRMETGSIYESHAVNISLWPKSCLAEKSDILQASELTLLHTNSPEDPDLLRALKQLSSSSKSFGVITICDSLEDDSAIRFLKVGVKEIIDLRNYTRQSLRRSVLSAKARGEVVEANRSAQRQALANQLQAEQALNEKSYFVSTVSHEIRSPLQNICGFASLLEETELDDEQKEYVTYVNRNATLLSELVSDVLDHSKLDQGTIALKIDDVSLKEAILDAISFVESRATSKRIAFAVHLDSSLPEQARADKLRIIQILKNLLDNAIKFTPEAGNIRVDARWTPESEVSQIGMLECSVEDSGCGISAERLPTIFSPFVQSEPLRDQEVGGTGLGLALCKKLCEIMRGSISIVKSDKQGTIIKFSIPIEQIPFEEQIDLPSTQENKRAKSSKYQQEGANILVIEDDQNSRAYIKRFIRYSGLECDVAENGEEAVKKFVPGKHLLVITDIYMPRISGIEVCSKLREVEKQSGIIARCKIYAISAGAGNETRSLILDAGADEYLRKPIRIDQLRHMIRDALPQRINTP